MFLRFVVLLTVSLWFPHFPMGGAIAIPAPANQWATYNLFVLDKDTNSVFLNANELFVASLRPLFPEIQTSADLAGKDDFYFYSDDLANQFRADDRLVIEGGVQVTRMEVNEPEGGQRTVVHVTKIPLRSSNGEIIGLRAIWFTPPSLNYRVMGNQIELSYPAEADIFRLERAYSLNPNAEWVSEPLLTNVISGKRVAIFPIEGAMAFYRLVSGTPVTLGGLFSLTGSWSTLGKSAQTALEIAVENANLQQLSSGSPLTFKLDIGDTALDPAAALTQLEALHDAGVQVVIGPQSSAEVRTLKPFTDQHDIMMVSPSSTASSLSVAGDNIFRFCPDDTFEAVAMVALLEEDKVQAIVPAWRDDAGNQGLHDSVTALFNSKGGHSSTGIRYAANTEDFSSVVTNLAAQVTDAQVTYSNRVAIYLAGFDEVAKLFELAATNEVLSNVDWYGSDGVVQSVALATNLIAARFAATHKYPNPTFGLDNQYRSIWEPIASWITTRSSEEVDAFALAAYDAANVAISTYLNLGPSPSFADLKTNFVAVANTYTGATGPTQLNAAGDRNGGAFDFWALKPDGEGFAWYRPLSFSPTSPGEGVIVRNE